MPENPVIAKEPFPKDEETVTISKEDFEQKVEEKYKGLLEVWKRDELVALEQRTEGLIADEVKKRFDEWQKAQKPPSPEDLQKLLDQNYLEFKVKLHTGDGEREFTIVELPQVVEQKFYRLFKNKLLQKASVIASIAQANMDEPMEKKFRFALDAIDESFDILAEACVLVLNPFGKTDGVTAEWIKSNLSSNRVWNIVFAQIEANRLRDFFSQISQAGNSMTNMIPGQNQVNFRR